MLAAGSATWVVRGRAAATRRALETRTDGQQGEDPVGRQDRDRGEPLVASGRPKITVVGAGNVGASVAQYVVEKELGDVVLVDVIEGVPQGKSLDLAQAGPIHRHDSTLIGSNGYDEKAGSDIVIITTGIGRNPGMTRDDLLFKKPGHVRGVVDQ